MCVCKYLKQRVRREQVNEMDEQVNEMENLSRVFQKQKRKKTPEEIKFHNSVQDSVFTTVYWLQKSVWINA